MFKSFVGLYIFINTIRFDNEFVKELNHMHT